MNETAPRASANSSAAKLTRRTALKVLTAATAASLTSTHLKAAGAAGVIGYNLHGNGPNRVIVLNDWSTGSAGDYGAVLPFFSPDLLTMALADVRGYGASKSMIGKFSSAEIAQDVAKLADHLKWDKFSILGHSMTGMAVQKVMAMMPERLNRVVATTPIPASGFPLDDASFAFFESMATDDEAFKNGMHALTSKHYGRAWAEFKLTQNRNSVSPDAMKTYTAMWSKEDFSADIIGNPTPILVVYGAHDNKGLRQPATGKKFQKWYPNLTEHICPSGHYPMLESPVDYAKAVQDFLTVI